MRRTEIKRRTISIPALNLNYYGGIIESIDIYGIRYTRDLDLDVLRVKINDLKEENAKLRELCLDLWASCPVHDEDCQTCKHYDGAFCDLYARIEELVKI